MRRTRFRTPIAFALLAFAAPGLVPMANAATVAKAVPQVRNASIRLNPVPGRPSAGYFTLIGTDKDETLVSVTAPGTRIEMHSMSMDGGIMKMAKLDSVRVGPGMGVHFDPGGNHLMIFGLTATATTLPLTFTFASGAKVTTTGMVMKAGADHGGH